MYLNKNLNEAKDGKYSIFLSNGFNGFSFGQSLNPIIISIKQYDCISKKCEHLFGTDEFKKFENSSEDTLVFSQAVKEFLCVEMLSIAPSNCYLYTSVADKERSKIAAKNLYEKIGLEFDGEKSAPSLRYDKNKNVFFNDYLNKAADESELIVLNDGIDSVYKGNVLLRYPVNPVILTIDEYKDLSNRCDTIFRTDQFKAFENSNTSSIVFDEKIRDYVGYSALTIGFKKWFATVSENERKTLEKRKKNFKKKLLKEIEIKQMLKKLREHNKRNKEQNRTTRLTRTKSRITSKVRKDALPTTNTGKGRA